MFAIVVNEKGGEQKRLEFDKPEVTIGRVQGNDIILPKGNVSKRHSRIVLKDGKFIIVDLKSTNGTYVNGRKITSPLVVKGSDKIYIGDFILNIEELSAEGAISDDASLPPAPPPRKSPTIPPPPSRRPTQPEIEDDSGAIGLEPDAEPEITPDVVQRSTRPTGPPMAAVPPTSPSPRITPPAPAAATRPPLSAERPVAPVPRPAPMPRPMPAPAPARERRPTGPTDHGAPRLAKPAHAGEGGERAKISDVMRELSSRLAANLQLASRGPEVYGDPELLARAESAAGELADQLNGALPSGVEAGALVRDVIAETLGTGPLEELLTDEEVREISIPRHDRIFVEKSSGTLSLLPKWFSSPEAVGRVVERLLARAGRTADLVAAKANGALVQARIEGGLLLTAALPPLAARGPSVTIRRPRAGRARLVDLVAQGLLTQPIADFLELAMKSRKNVLVSGPAGSGRSTVLAAMIRSVAEGARLVSVEESEELELGDGPWIQLLARGAGARHAVANALRLKPDRLIIGDVHGAEALDVIGALAGGADGAICVVQAGSARDALSRMEALARMAPEAPPIDVLRAGLGRGLHVVVHLTRSSEGEARIGEIAEVTFAGGNLGVQPIYTFRADATGGRFAASGHIPAWAEGAPPSLFR